MNTRTRIIQILASVSKNETIKPEVYEESMKAIDSLLPSRMAAALAVLLTMSACGSGENDTTEIEKVQIVEKKAVEELSENKITMYLSDLPECKASNFKQLVYVTSEEKFFSCEKNGWAAAIVSNVTNNVTNNYLSSFVFHDEKTGRDWIVKDPTSSYTACPDSTSATLEETFETPSGAQIKEVLQNGIFEGVNVKVFTTANRFVYSKNPDTILNTTHYTGTIYAFNLCLISQ